MKFTIRHTSGEDPGLFCQKATEETIECRDPVNGNVYHNTYWFIEISTLEELMDLAKSNGDLVVNVAHDGWGHNFPSIEIYDDYRE